MNLLIFLVAFCGLVIVHEFGHFIVARWCKIEVEEFGIGLPSPGAITLFTWKGTRFTLNWILLGGFVRPKGENDPSVAGGLAAANPWKRLAVLFAGPLMNLLAAVVIFSVITSIRGGILTIQPDGENPRMLITGVLQDSPAEKAGLRVGDILISGGGQPINDPDNLEKIITASVGNPIPFVIERNGKQIDLVITPKYYEEQGRALIGIDYCPGCSFQPITSVYKNIETSLKITGYQVYELVTLPVKLIRGTIPREQGRLVGLKGIYDIMKQTVANDVEASQTQATAPTSDPFNKPVQTLSLVALLSISLGVFNLFPFPALDGGRIIFVLPEILTRRRIPAQFENLVHGLGMTVLLLFMIYVNVMEFIRPTIP